MPPADAEEPGFQHTLDRISKARYFTVSLVVHIGFVVLFGGAVLFQSAVELPDFLAGEGDLVDASANTGGPPAPPPSAATPTFAVQTLQTAAPDITAITSTAVPTRSFVMNAIPVMVPVKIDTNMDRMMAATRNMSRVGSTGSLPSTMAARGAGQRGTAMRKNGMKEGSENAVLAGLRWLVKYQNPDGTWGQNEKGAMTGLALLCFLGHGEVPDSAEFGPTVGRAIDVIVERGIENDGWLHMKGNNSGDGSGSYAHGIATYALGEAYTLTRDDRIPSLLEKSVGKIVAGMAEDNGWSYGYSREMPSDTSVGGWQIQALKAAHLTGLDIPQVDQTLDKAMKGLLRVQAKTGENAGGFGYRTADDVRYSLTGVGVLCQQIWKPNAESVRDGIDFMESGPKVDYRDETANLYTWYYNAQALLMKGGSAWTKWNRIFQDQIAGAQSRDGSWPPHGGHEIGEMNERTPDANVYRTALCVLMLEVYYRYLPKTK